MIKFNRVLSKILKNLLGAYFWPPARFLPLQKSMDEFLHIYRKYSSNMPTFSERNFGQINTSLSNFGLNEFVKPLSHNDRYVKPREIFLLTPDEYEKVNRLVENIREMIELHKKKISLYKEMVPSAMNELINK